MTASPDGSPEPRRPSVAVLVPTFRRPALLRRTLQSVVSQADPSYRLSVHVYDNASGDETESVVRGFEGRGVDMIYVGRPSNIGAIRNFTDAIQNVRTDYFAIVSDDDVLLPGGLKENVSQLERNPRASAWNGIVINCNDQRVLAYRPAPQWPAGAVPGDAALDLLSRNVRPETTGMVFRSSLIARGFCPADEAFLAQDMLWLAVATRHGAIGVTRRPSAILFSHGESQSSDLASDRAVDVLFPSVPMMVAWVEQLPLEPDLRRRIVDQYWRHYGEYGLTVILYRALMAGDLTLVDRVRGLARRHPSLAGVEARASAAVRAPRWRLRLLLAAFQLRRGNPRHKLTVVRSRGELWRRFSSYCRT